METQGRAVTIYVRQDDGSYKLDLEALGKILNQEGVGDLPIMVISVAGAMREGKSFLLNLFIKYLESGQNEELLSNDSKLKGFSCRGGPERDTLGILMWSKPYHIQDEIGQRVAVLLMDTQGAFDNEHTMAQSTRIITMSLMMCSLQIYNVMQTLRADKLEFFSLFLEHAKMVKSETKENVFQSLMFLVRDWPHQEDHDFGLDGGTAHIKKQLQRLSKKAKIGKEDFKDIFNHYEGFLLPHPGEKVAEQRMGSKPFEGKTSDMNEDFIKYIGRLVRHLFRKDHVVKKAITGANVNGRTLLAYAENIAKLLENEDMPAPKDLVKAQIQAHCSNMKHLDEFTRKFREKMNQITSSDEPVEESTLKDFHSKISAETTKAFMSRLGKLPPNVESECRAMLNDTLKHAFSDLQRENEQKKRDCELKAKQIVADCLEVYNAEMNEVTKGNILDNDEMKSNHEAASAKARDKLSAQKVGLSYSITKKMEDTLTQSISDRHVYFNHDNERRKAWAEKEVSERMQKLEKVYKDEVNYLNEGRPWSEVDLRRHHRTALEKVKAKAREARSGEIRQLCLDEIEESAATWWMETENDNNAKTVSLNKRGAKKMESKIRQYAARCDKLETSRSSLGTGVKAASSKGKQKLTEIHEHKSIGPKGGEIKASECGVVFPPGAVVEETNFHIFVEHRVHPSTAEHVQVTPLIRCLPAMRFHIPVKVKLQKTCRSKPDTVMAHVMMQREGSSPLPFADIPLSAGNEFIEFECRHFTWFWAYIKRLVFGETEFIIQPKLYLSKRGANFCLALLADDAPDNLKGDQFVDASVMFNKFRLGAGKDIPISLCCEHPGNFEIEPAGMRFTADENFAAFRSHRMTFIIKPVPPLRETFTLLCRIGDQETRFYQQMEPSSGISIENVEYLHA